MEPPGIFPCGGQDCHLNTPGPGLYFDLLELEKVRKVLSFWLQFSSMDWGKAERHWEGDAVLPFQLGVTAGHRCCQWRQWRDRCSSGIYSLEWLRDFHGLLPHSSPVASHWIPGTGARDGFALEWSSFSFSRFSLLTKCGMESWNSPMLSTAELWHVCVREDRLGVEAGDGSAAARQVRANLCQGDDNFVSDCVGTAEQCQSLKSQCV